ncbi:MAG: hypothetical protein II972_01210 [Elusimicrobiaceae bacterium]|nr:hypothetical protein [Elusimicrobiaceae bacterium]
MKQKLLFLLFLFFPLLTNAEAIKLKSGLIINGSIVGQTEYILNVKTSYGTIAINQREVEKIMPDLHRIILKGGGEFIGNIVDMDEFTLSLNTDNGLVNIDVPQISSMEIYDYNEAEKQKKYIQTKHELEEQATQELSQKNANASELEQAKVKAAAGSTISSSGLEFDADLEKLFPSKPVVEAPKDVYVRFDNKNTSEKQEEEPSTPQKEIKQLDETSQAFKKDFSKNNFEVFLGYQNLPLKLDLTEHGLSTGEDINSANIAFGLSYLRKINSRLWLGADIAMGMLSKHNFEPNATTHIETSGQVYNIDLKANYYLNPKSLTRFYAQAGAGFSSASINKNLDTFNGTDWIQEDTKTISSSNISALFGFGVERSIEDLNLGLEVKGRYTSYSGKLKESDNLSFLIAAKINWYF